VDVAVILNPKAGAVGGLRYLRKFFGDAGSQPAGRYRVFVTGGPGDARRLAEKCVEQGFAVIAAMGGDGTVNEVAGALVGTAARLGVIPLGSGNGFARAFGIPLDPLEALRGLGAYATQTIDVGRCGSRFFFTTAGIGLDAEVARSFMRTFGRVRGQIPYFLLTAWKVLFYRPDPIVLESNGFQYRGKPMLVAICNTGQYGSGAVISPRSRPHDGRLDVCILERVNPVAALRYAHALFGGFIDRLPAMKTFPARKAVLHAGETITLQLDGEVVETNGPVEFDVVPASLHVLAPAVGCRLP
jgi:YegS/Rv2252/BmrU family lipid kinase